MIGTQPLPIIPAEYSPLSTDHSSFTSSTLIMSCWKRLKWSAWDIDRWHGTDNINKKGRNISMQPIISHTFGGMVNQTSPTLSANCYFEAWISHVVLKLKSAFLTFERDVAICYIKPTHPIRHPILQWMRTGRLCHTSLFGLIPPPFNKKHGK